MSDLSILFDGSSVYMDYLLVYFNLLALIATKKLKWKPFQMFICDI